MAAAGNSPSDFPSMMISTLTVMFY
uniref:Uncharacterized protein n=1 Tax=Romanomermis culicivorax TaxID=13658 RepID=A0A915JAB3_ROMCU